jgi:hypothetical protein
VEQQVPNIPVVEDMDWKQYQMLVIQKLNEHSSSIKTVESKLDEVQIDIAALRGDFGKLEVKAGFWGGCAGLVATLIALFKAKMGIFS